VLLFSRTPVKVRLDFFAPANIMSFVNRLLQTQTLPVESSVLWDFVSVPQNLNEITPPDMAFEIVGDHPEKTYPGLLLEYRVKIPFVGWTPWLTEIKYVEEGVSFVDEQRVGPYKIWLHTHRLETVAGGTKMTDDIRYQLPFGPLGALAHWLFVRRTLCRIFDFRKHRLNELFPPK
jgi:ligand-binding SRPBCC domain-containing protein